MLHRSEPLSREYALADMLLSQPHLIGFIPPPVVTIRWTLVDWAAHCFTRADYRAYCGSLGGVTQ